MHALTLVHEERCSPWKHSNELKEEEQEKGEGEKEGERRGRVEGETGGGRNRRKEGEEEGGSRERFGEGGEGEGGTICIPLWILPGNHTLAESR